MKTTINNIVRCYLVGKGGSEMKHIQKDYKVEMYIPREFTANQNVVIVGERNDEDHAVPSVMKLIEKLTDEEVDGVILETEVENTSSIPRERIPERLIVQIVNMSGHTQNGG